jgi:hypothetical protein
MQLTNTTDRYQSFIQNTATATAAKTITTYQLDAINVVFTETPTQKEVLLISQTQNIAPEVIDFVLAELCHTTRENCDLVLTERLAEIVTPSVNRVAS